MIDTLIETIAGIEYHRTPTEYEARYKGMVICNRDLDRLKQDAPAVLDLINEWRRESINE